MTIKSTINRVVRGIRDTIPSGYILGRKSGGDGSVELISLRELGTQLTAAAGGTSSVTAVPAGGNTGQVLTKHSNANYDATWQTPAANPTVDAFSPPTAASFTTIVSGSGGTTTVTDQTYGMLFDSGPTVSGTNNCYALKAIAGSTWTMTAGLRVTMGPNLFRSAGLVVTDGTKYVVFGLQWNNGVSGNLGFYVTYMNSPTSFNSNPSSLAYHSADQYYLRIKNDGTNLLFSFSHDGRNFVQLFSLAKGAFLGTITKYGIGSSAQANSTPPAVGDHVYIVCFNWSDTTP